MAVGYERSKKNHNVRLWEHEEILLQKVYEELDGCCRRPCNFLSVLITIALDRVLDCTNHSEYEQIFTLSRDRNALRFEGKPAQTEVQKSFTDLMGNLKASLNAFENTMSDNVTPHNETKIIQFPQRYVFSGSA